MAAFRRIPEHRFLSLRQSWVPLAIFGLYLLTCNEWVQIIGDNIVYIRDARRLVQGKGVVDSQYGLGVKSMLIPAVVLFPDSVARTQGDGRRLPVFCSRCVHSWSSREFTDNSRALLIALISGGLLGNGRIFQHRHRGRSLPGLLAARPLGNPPIHQTPGNLLEMADCSGLLRGLGLPREIAVHLPRDCGNDLSGASQGRSGNHCCSSHCAVRLGSTLGVLPQGQLSRFTGLPRHDRADCQTGFNIPDSEAGTFWQNFFYYIFQKNPVDYLTEPGIPSAYPNRII